MHYAIAGLARSNFTRSNYAPPRAPRRILYAISKIARSDATRSNYIGKAVFITIGGIEVGSNRPPGGPRALYDSLRISEVLDEAPNTATLRVLGGTFQVGAEVLIKVGSRANTDPLFAGRVLSLQHGYLLEPRHAYQDLNLIDHTWGLGRYILSNRFSGSATTIAKNLIAYYTLPASGYSTTGVAPDLPTVDGITFTNQTIPTALTQLCKRVGAVWFCDYNKNIHVTLETVADPLVTPPFEVRPDNPTLSLEGFSADRDLSQMISRVWVEGGGTNAIASLAPGETIIPVQDASWYEDAGVVVSGPQRPAYTGKRLGGGGSLVGPGAAPTTSPYAAIASGAGINTGTHAYSTVFQTAAGYSLAGPRVSIAVGAIPPPTVAPTLAGFDAGAGPSPGVHRYAVTHVTTAGETTPGPTVEVTTPTADPPNKGPSAAANSGAGLDEGEYQYATTYHTPLGETTPGPLSPVVVTYTAPGLAIADPTVAPSASLVEGTGLAPGAYRYAVTFGTSGGETTGGPQTTITTLAEVPAVPPGPGLSPPPSIQGHSDYYDANPIGLGRFGWRYSWKRNSDGVETPLCTTTYYLTWQWEHYFPTLECWLAPQGWSIALYRTSDGGDSTTLRRFPNPDPVIYTGGGVMYLGDRMKPGTTTTPWPGTPPGTPGVPAIPAKCRVTLQNIQVGPSGTVRRNIYRSAAGSSDLRKLGEIPNNSGGQMYLDDRADSALGSSIPSSNNTAVPSPVRRVNLTGIPVPSSGDITAKSLFRRKGGGALQWIADLALATTTYEDASSSAGRVAPGVNNAWLTVIVINLPPGGALVSRVKVYGTIAGGSILQLIADLTAAEATAPYRVTTPDASLGAPAPAVNTAAANQVDLSGIAPGPPGVLYRHLYRTAANDATLKLLATIADNVTTTYHDAAADAALGALVPSSDTSGLTQPTGVVLPGATTLVVASVRDFPTTGGWAPIGNGQQVIRYSGISGAQTLTGIPAVGVGAITASVSYGSTITNAPCLTGVTGINFPIVHGDPVNLWIRVDDLAAQALLRTLITGTDGVIEDYLQDRRLSATEARARGTAHLAARNQINVTVRYRSHDLNTTVGARVLVNLPAPIGISGEFSIQQVTIGEFDPRGRSAPTFTVEASSTRFSFDDLLRLAQSPALRGDY